ncbi:MAG: HU family DNA-binding protein [Candidatus Contendobacter sp.]
MSALATTYRLYSSNTNPLQNFSLDDANGIAKPYTSWAQQPDENGLAVWQLEYAEPTECVFATPIFTDPNNPVPVYLAALSTDGLNYIHTLSGQVFNSVSASADRPTAYGAHYIGYVKSASADPVTGHYSWAIKVPAQVTPKIKARTKDPLTGVKLYGNDISMLWYGPLPLGLQIQCDVEDITDPAGWFDLSDVTNVTGYAESSVGMSLLKINSEIVPQDGFSHSLKFRVRYNLAGDVSEWVETPWKSATYLLPPPNPVSAVAATLIRDRNDVVPDRLRVDWTWAATDPGDAVEVYAIDYLGKKHLLGEETDNAVTSMTVENVSRFVTQATGPANQSAYRFGVIAKNRTTKSDLVLTASPLLITNKLADTSPPTPDEIAGTAHDRTHNDVLSLAFNEVDSLPGLSPDQITATKGHLSFALDAITRTVKSIVKDGGSATLNHLGTFRAKWTSERWGRNPSNGDPVLIPASRSNAFTPSQGYKVGTKYGLILTDTEAKTYTPPSGG